jgi:WAS/WASL-interacting protein
MPLTIMRGALPIQKAGIPQAVPPKSSNSGGSQGQQPAYSMGPPQARTHSKGRLHSLTAHALPPPPVPPPVAPPPDVPLAAPAPPGPPPVPAPPIPALALPPAPPFAVPLAPSLEVAFFDTPQAPNTSTLNTKWALTVGKAIVFEESSGATAPLERYSLVLPEAISLRSTTASA